MVNSDQPAPLGDTYDDIKHDNTATAPLNNVKKGLEENISDPTNSENRKFILIGEPQRKSRESKWPYVAITGVTELPEDGDKQTLNGEYRSLNGSIEIEIEAVDDGVRAKQDYLNLVDQVKSIFRAEEKVELGKVSMHGITLVEDNEPPGIFEDDKPVLKRELEFEFDSMAFFGDGS